MARWWSGLTQRPFTASFTSSNLVRVTIKNEKSARAFLFLVKTKNKKHDALLKPDKRWNLWIKESSARRETVSFVQVNAMIPVADVFKLPVHKNGQ